MLLKLYEFLLIKLRAEIGEMLFRFILFFKAIFWSYVAYLLDAFFYTYVLGKSNEKAAQLCSFFFFCIYVIYSLVLYDKNKKSA